MTREEKNFYYECMEIDRIRGMVPLVIFTEYLEGVQIDFSCTPRGKGLWFLEIDEKGNFNLYEGAFCGNHLAFFGDRKDQFDGVMRELVRCFDYPEAMFEIDTLKTKLQKELERDIKYVETERERLNG